MFHRFRNAFKRTKIKKTAFYKVSGPKFHSGAYPFGDPPRHESRSRSPRMNRCCRELIVSRRNARTQSAPRDPTVRSVPQPAPGELLKDDDICDKSVSGKFGIEPPEVKCCLDAWTYSRQL